MAAFKVLGNLAKVPTHQIRNFEHLPQKYFGLLGWAPQHLELGNSLPSLRNAPLAIFDVAPGSVQIILGVEHGRNYTGGGVLARQ